MNATEQTKPHLRIEWHPRLDRYLYQVQDQIGKTMVPRSPWRDGAKTVWQTVLIATGSSGITDYTVSHN